MLDKCNLSEMISRVDPETEGQIWVDLTGWPALKLGSVYIPKEDSPYFQPSLYGALAAYTLLPGRVIVMGDFSARVGEPRPTNEMKEVCDYNGVKDFTVNSHEGYWLTCAAIIQW